MLFLLKRTYCKNQLLEMNQNLTLKNLLPKIQLFNKNQNLKYYNFILLHFHLKNIFTKSQ